MKKLWYYLLNTFIAFNLTYSQPKSSNNKYFLRGINSNGIYPIDYNF